MKKLANSILFTVLGATVLNAKEVDCLMLSQSVAIEVSVNKAQVLEIVSSQVAAAPGCACEIVKSAIKSSECDAATVAAIVGAAISEAPEQLRLISQCAIAAAPDAIGAIQALLVTLDPNSGDSADSSKSSKSAKAAAITNDEVAAVDWNPLDFPGDKTSPINGFSLRSGPRAFRAPPVINVSLVTDPNP